MWSSSLSFLFNKKWLYKDKKDFFPDEQYYTLNNSSKWYIAYICRVFRKGLNADKSYYYFNFLWIIKIHNVVFVHFMSSCQYQLPAKHWHLKQNGVLSQNNQDAENVVHPSNFCQRRVSDDFKVYWMVNFTRTVAIFEVAWSLPVC